MPNPIESIDPKLYDEVWRIASRLEWTAEDWKTFYWAVAKAFVEIAGRHAKQKMEGS